VVGRLNCKPRDCRKYSGNQDMPSRDRTGWLMSDSQDRLVLTEAQVVPTARFESEHPGYCGGPGHVVRRQSEGGGRKRIEGSTGVKVRSASDAGGASRASKLQRIPRLVAYGWGWAPLSNISFVIFHRNVPSGVVGHQSCRYEAHDGTSGDVPGDRVARVIGGEQRRRD
jgi:hypothetical protein